MGATNILRNTNKETKGISVWTSRSKNYEFSRCF